MHHPHLSKEGGNGQMNILMKTLCELVIKARQKASETSQPASKPYGYGLPFVQIEKEKIM